MEIIALVAAGAFIAGFVQGMTGFGFGLAAMVFWSWTLPPGVAAPLVVFGSLVGQVLGLGALWRSFNLRRALPFLVGGALGIPLGVALLRDIDPGHFKLLVGVVLVVYCLSLLFVAELPRIGRGGRLADGVAAWIGGIMGGLSGMSAPVPTLWCVLRGWPRDEQRAVFQSFNLVVHALTLTAYGVGGVLTAETNRLFLVVAPAMLVPTLFGLWLYRRFDDVLFRKLVLALLAISGAMLLVSGVRG